MLTFHLLAPESQSWFVGDLTFTTRVRIHGSISSGRTRSSHLDLEPNPLPDLAAKVERLPDSSKKELYAELHRLIPRKKPVQKDPSIITTPLELKEEFHRRPVSVEEPNMVRSLKDPRLALHRDAKQKFVERFLGDRGIK